VTGNGNLLPSRWATISALDLYMHELIAQNLSRIFDGTRPSCSGFARLHISSDTLMRIQSATTAANRSSAFDLEVRTKLSRVTYQYPEEIADGVRLISPCKLWNDVALKLGATVATVSAHTELLKKRLSLLVDRRNKIVHEGDLQPMIPRTPWPVTRADVSDVAAFIHDIVCAIDSIV
jgi:RiboL-PSP-HEPN